MRLETYLDSLFFVIVLLDHIDCFLDVAEHQVAVTIVGLYRRGQFWCALSQYM